MAPPSLSRAVPQPGGRVLLAGEAQPGANVRLATPAGDAIHTIADSGGAWRIVLPPSAGLRLFGLSMSEGSRTTQAEGYLAIAPDGRAAQLRAGAGTLVLGRRQKALAVLAVDFDNLGEADKLRAAVISGAAPAGASVGLSVDGIQRQVTADQDGRFMSLNEPLSDGEHLIEAVQGGLRVQVRAPVTHAAPLTPGPFRAERMAYGWRIDWMTPGGGVQSTLILEPSEAPS